MATIEAASEQSAKLPPAGSTPAVASELEAWILFKQLEVQYPSKNMVLEAVMEVKPDYSGYQVQGYMVYESEKNPGHWAHFCNIIDATRWHR